MARFTVDLTGEKIRFDVAPHAVHKTCATIRLSPSEVPTLLPHFEQVFSDPTSELKLNLPQQWTFYCKLKAGEGRLFVAHPQTGEWVATLSLDQSSARKFLDGLRALASPGMLLELSQVVNLSRLSNLELVIETV